MALAKITRGSLLAIGSLTLLLSAAEATGQAYITPTRFKDAEGTFGLSHALGNGALKNRFLQFIKMDKSRTVTQVSLRRDGDVSRDYPRFALVADMYVSSYGRRGFLPDPVFDKNHGTNKVQAANVGVFVFPITRKGPLPHPFVYRFPFETPFKFQGTTSLCWEVLTHYRTTEDQIVFDAGGNWNPNPQPVANAYGTGCIATGQTAPIALNGGASASWNRVINLDYAVSNLPPNAQAFLVFGANGWLWNGIQLPFLIPGSQYLPSGPCSIYHDFQGAMPFQADNNGEFSIPFFNLPTSEFKNGTNIYAQVLYPDSGSPLGFALSNGFQHHVITPINSTLPIGHAYLEGSHGPVGNVLQWQGYIIGVN